MQPIQEQAPPAPPAHPGIVGAPVSIGSGEREWLRGPLSREVSYRLVVSGDVGARELGKLIKFLQAQQAVLQDDDDDIA
jgi:hypothetical protein